MILANLFGMAFCVCGFMFLGHWEKEMPVWQRRMCTIIFGTAFFFLLFLVLGEVGMLAYKYFLNIGR